MKPKILIADDDSVCRLLLQSMLAKPGREVLTARDGDEAWRLLQETHGALLAILDWHMPGIEGVELCRRIRELTAASTSSLPIAMCQLPARLIYIVLLTGRTGRDSVIRGLEAGAHDYITKPFDQDELHARVQVGMRVLSLQQMLADRVRELEDALKRVKQLQGLLPMCSYCKCIRNDKDYWQQVEHYIADHSELQFSHGICPSCYKRVVEPQLAALRRNVSTKTQ
jgi:DNA-binding response OmpR family regulator